MNPQSERWTAISESVFPWEQEALAFVRERLPDQEPYRAYSNFEFIGEDGSLNEVDLLVVTANSVVLVEIKSRPGLLTGDQGTWTWTTDTRRFVDDNPIWLANRKAKKLKALLGRSAAFRHYGRPPYVDAMVFLSSPELDCQLDWGARRGVALRAAKNEMRDVIDLLTSPVERPEGGFYPSRIDATLSRTVARALDEIGIRPSNRAKRIGDYQLDRLIFENDFYQDWEASHLRLDKVRQRVRIYPVAVDDPSEVRAEKRRAAEREFNLLMGITHPGILKATNFTEHERGPAVFFEHDPGAQRLDHFLGERLSRLDMSERLTVVRHLAETLQFAHAHRLFHRILSPQTVLVTDPDKVTRGLKVLDWQAGKRQTGSIHSSQLSTDGLMPLGLLGDPQSLCYLAPESIAGLEGEPVKLDIFSLGTIAYHVFAGRPPAASIQELKAKCVAGKGLHVSEALDGASIELEELIQQSTAPLAADRYDSLAEFLDQLTRVEAALSQPQREATVHPLKAQVNDHLEGGFLVRKRLGTGSTSLALLVQRGEQLGVLKVASSTDHNARLRREAQVLRDLRHANIVEMYDVFEIGGHVALFLAQSGGDTRTLAQRLRDDGPLSLEMLRRFGEELLTAVEWIERNGVHHRDIKPDNITIGETRTGQRTLVLFDFSLTDVPAEDLRAGTPPYLDPFLGRRTPPRWDLHAERFAAAMTLYEMATAELPYWGDEHSDPGLLNVEVTLDDGRFDPAVREGMVAFFRKALHSNSQQRFDTAESMRRAWGLVFEHVDRPIQHHEGDGEQDLTLEGVTRATELGRLGISPLLLNAMEFMGAHTVDQLLKLPKRALYRKAGVGNKTLRAIRDIVDRLGLHFEENRVTEPPVEEIVLAGDERRLSVDSLLRKVAEARIDEAEREILRAFFGLAGGSFPSQSETAERSGVPRHTVQQALERARARWLKEPWMTALRMELLEFLTREGGIATGEELARAILSTRGSFHMEPERTRNACAVVYAAIETEAERDNPRFLLYRGRHDRVFVALVPEAPDVPPTFLATVAARAQHAERLAARADELALEIPLASPARAQAALLAVEGVSGEEPMTPERLLRLAVAGSKGAALSSRQEIYPRGMSANQALRLGMGALLGAKQLSTEDVRTRIHGRYPEAEPLPERPMLDELLEKVGLDLLWDDARRMFCVPSPKSLHVTTGTLPHFGTSEPVGTETLPEVESARELHDRLERAIAGRCYLVLTALTKRLERAESELLRQFPGLLTVSLERVLVQALKDQARARGIDWQVVIRADGMAQDSQDWANLQMLVMFVKDQVKRRLLESEAPVLLQHCGLLARYGQVGLLEELRTACGAPGSRAPGFLVLLPTDDQFAAPRIEQEAVPVVTRAEWAHLSEAWLSNLHKTLPVPAV